MRVSVLFLLLISFFVSTHSNAGGRLELPHLLCDQFTLTRSSRAILRRASWVLPCNHTGFQLVQLSPGQKRELAQWRRSRLSIRVMERMVSI